MRIAESYKGAVGQCVQPSRCQVFYSAPCVPVPVHRGARRVATRGELCEEVRVVLCVCLLHGDTDREGERHAFVLRVCYTVDPQLRNGVMRLLDGNKSRHDAQ